MQHTLYLSIYCQNLLCALKAIAFYLQLYSQKLEEQRNKEVGQFMFISFQKHESKNIDYYAIVK